MGLSHFLESVVFGLAAARWSVGWSAFSWQPGKRMREAPQSPSLPFRQLCSGGWRRDMETVFGKAWAVLYGGGGDEYGMAPA
jgi:hypothetical protein